MSAYGTSPLGTSLGPFGGPGLITVLGALPESTNSVLLVFDRVPNSDSPGLYYSATNPTRYILTAVDPTYESETTTLVPTGAKVPTRFPRIYKAELDDADPTQIRLFSDSRLEPTVSYEIEVNPSIRGENGETFAGTVTFTVEAPRLPDQISSVAKREERYRDFAFSMTDGSEGFQYDSSGDIAMQSAGNSLAKRLQRRLFSKKRSFAWSPDYGADVSVKSLAKVKRLQEASVEIRRQFLQEPDVLDASVVVTLVRGDDGIYIDIDASVLRSDHGVNRVSIREPLD